MIFQRRQKALLWSKGLINIHGFHDSYLRTSHSLNEAGSKNGQIKVSKKMMIFCEEGSWFNPYIIRKRFFFLKLDKH